MGIDLKPISVKLPGNVSVHTGDVFSLNPSEMGNGFHAVISDMAPSTTGNKNVDAARSFELCMAALSISEKYLKPEGSFVCKFIQGEDFKIFQNLVRKQFREQKIFKPQSSRKASKEIFIIGLDKTGGKNVGTQ